MKLTQKNDVKTGSTSKCCYDNLDLHLSWRKCLAVPRNEENRALNSLGALAA